MLENLALSAGQSPQNVSSQTTFCPQAMGCTPCFRVL